MKQQPLLVQIVTLSLILANNITIHLMALYLNGCWPVVVSSEALDDDHYILYMRK